VDAAAFGLATFRLARLVGLDDFPPVERLRRRLIGHLGDDHPLAEAVACPWCSSVYVAAALLALHRSPRFRRLLWIPAASAVAGLLATADSALGRAWPERAADPAQLFQPARRIVQWARGQERDLEAAFLGERKSDVGRPRAGGDGR
jgi:hypothetical protein